VASLPSGAKDALAHRHALCKHEGGCVEQSGRALLRGFIVGYCLRAAVALVGALANKRTRTHPSRLLGSLFSDAALRTGLFLALWGGLRLAVACLLRHARNKDDRLNALVAGGVSGLSAIFSPSLDVSMYLLFKMFEGVYRVGVKRDVIRPIPHGDSLLFALGCGLLFFTSVLEPYNMRPNYFRFINKCSGSRYSMFEWPAKAYAPEWFAESGFRY